MPFPNRGPISSLKYEPQNSDVLMNKKKNQIIWRRARPPVTGISCQKIHFNFQSFIKTEYYVYCYKFLYTSTLIPSRKRLTCTESVLSPGECDHCSPISQISSHWWVASHLIRVNPVLMVTPSCATSTRTQTSPSCQRLPL